LRIGDPRQIPIECRRHDTKREAAPAAHKGRRHQRHSEPADNDQQKSAGQSATHAQAIDTLIRMDAQLPEIGEARLPLCAMNGIAWANVHTSRIV